MSIQSTLLKTITLTTLLSTFSLTSTAETMSELSDIEKIEHRQNIMENYDDWDKKLSDTLKSDTLDADVLKDAAVFFKDNSGDTLLALFPEIETPEGVETKAKDAIWRSFDEFTAITNDVNSAAIQTINLIETGDLEAAKTALNPIINSCRACHRKYKAR